MQLPEFLTEVEPGEISLIGHRIGLFTIGESWLAGLSAEQIQDEYPSLELPLIQKTLAFCAAHQDEVTTYVGEYRKELDRKELKGRRGPSLDELRRRAKSRQETEARSK